MPQRRSPASARSLLSAGPNGLGWKTRGPRRPPPPVGRYAAKVAQPVYKKFGFSEPHIIEHWPDIVGAGLARRTLPQRLSAARSRGAGGATLTIRVEGASGLELQHMAPQVMERINGYYGYNAVDKLRFVQGPIPKERPARAPRQRELLASEQRELEGTLSDLPEGSLKAALSEMGAHVRRRNAANLAKFKPHR